MFGDDGDLAEAGQLYQTWCHDQPLCLFKQDGFTASLARRDVEVRLAVRAISLHFPPGALTPDRQRRMALMTRWCRGRIAERVVDGRVGLSTLQTLCILSVVSFASKSTPSWTSSDK